MEIRKYLKLTETSFSKIFVRKMLFIFDIWKFGCCGLQVTLECVLGAIKYYNVCTERLLCRKGCDILHSYMSALSLLILWWREGAGGFVDTLTMFYWVDRLYCFLNIAVNNHLTTQTIQTFLWQNVMKIFMRLQWFFLWKLFSG